MNKYPIIGSFISLNAKNDYLIGATKNAIKNGGNSFMFFNGSPQNTKKLRIEKEEIAKFHQLWKEQNYDSKNIIIHAPYIINIANSEKPSVWEFSVQTLKKEILSAHELGIETIILHPGSYTTGNLQTGLKQIIKALNIINKNQENNVKIALETMSGKGTEIGWNFNQLKYIIDNIEDSKNIGVCLDTCHLYSSGYDLKKWEDVKQEIKNTFGINKVWAIHLNDSKTPFASRKDRHENIDCGSIGLAVLKKIVWDTDFKDIPKILETPWPNNKPIYEKEIKMLIE